MTRGRRLRLASAPIAVICALLVLAEVGNFGKVIEKEWSSYSLGKDNVMQLVGHSCGLSDYVDVEPNPARDILTPVRQPAGSPNGSAMTGFTLGGLPSWAPSDIAVPLWLPPLPATAAVPVWGNYGSSGPKAAGALRTSWYALPAAARSGAAPLIVDVAGVVTGGNSLVAEFGKRTPTGFQVVRQQPIGAQTDTDPTVDPTSWRESRVTLAGAAQQADDVRLVATTQAVGQNNWLALSAPRVPTLVRMTDFLGSKPVFMEWPVALVDPCIRPFDTRDGISQMPAYRISGGTDLRDVGQTWSAPDAGGPFGWLNVNSTETTLPTFLKGNLNRDWGTLYAIAPDVPAAPASSALQIAQVTHWGLYSPGPGSKPIELPGVAQKSNDRGNVSVVPGH